MKVVVDRSRCTAIGICESLAPDYFEVGDDGQMAVLRQDVDPAEARRVQEAAGSCPARALFLY